MKRLLLLSLILFTALVFQSCKKVSYNIDGGDLVPIVFSQAVTTKTLGTLADPIESFNALVLGSKVTNNWETIYSSTEFHPTGSQIDAPAKGRIHFNHLDITAASFTPPVYYPTDDDTYIFIKALAPFEAIETMARDLAADNSTVIFTIDGTRDIMATKLTTYNPDKLLPNEVLHGCGKRGSEAVPKSIDLVFDHLLSKIDFYIQAEDQAAVTDFWGDFVSITFKNGYNKFTYNLKNHKHDLLPGALKTANFPVEPAQNITILPKDQIDGQNTGYACSVIVYPTQPSEVGSDKIAWEIEVVTAPFSGGENKRTISSKLVLVEAHEHKVTLTFNKTKQVDITSVTVTQWSDTGSTGNIPGIE